MAGLALGNLLVALAAAGLAAAVPCRRRCERVLLALLLAPALLEPLLLALGVAGRLRPAWALAGVATLAAAGAGSAQLARRRGRAAADAGPRSGGGLPTPWRLRWRVPRCGVGWLLAAAGVSGLALVLGAALLLPPGGWDEWWYHLPPLAAAVQTGRLAPAPLPLEWSDPAVAAAYQRYPLAYRLSQTGFWATVYPQGAELWALWPALFLHSDALVDASQGYFALLGAAAVYALARGLGARRGLALAGAGLWLCTPVVLAQSGVVASDLAFAAATLAALAGCVAWARRGSAGALPIWALGAGLALAAKATGLPLAGLWIVLALALGLRRAGAVPTALKPGRAEGATAGTHWPEASELSRSPLPERAGRALAPALAVLVGCATLGGYWYARNWARWGNPVYPVSASLGPLRLPGLGSVEQLFLAANTPEPYVRLAAAQRLLATWWEAWPEPISYFDRTGGLGPAWPLAVAALLCLAVGSAVRALRQAVGRPAPGRRASPGAGLLLLAGGVALGLLLIQPGAWWPRYTLALIGAGYGLLPPLLQRLAGAPRRAALAALTAAALLGLPPALGDIAGYIPVAMALPPAQRTIGKLRHGDYAWVDTLPPGAAIAYAPMALIYPLYGRRFEHPVVQVDGHNPTEWLAALRASGAGWVCTLTGYGPHAAWARALAPALRPAGTSGGLAIWQVTP